MDVIKKKKKQSDRTVSVRFGHSPGLELQFQWQHRTGVKAGFSIRSSALAQSVSARGGTVGSAPVGWVGSGISLLTPTLSNSF